jgi:hypothetical protein
MQFNFDDARRQLELLGKDPKTTRLRCIHKQKGAVSFGFDLDRAKALSLQGYGVYIVVNAGGDKDREITQGLAIFAEWDDRSEEWQRTAWQELGLPEPTYQMATGGKSIHSYWVLSEPCIDVAKWRQLQADQLDHTDADRSIKNPARVMRLAGFPHQATGQLAKLEGVTEARYSFDELRALIPQKASIEPITERVARPIPTNIRIDAATGVDPKRFLSREHKDLVDHGIPQGLRNSLGLELSMALAGIIHSANHEGIKLAYDPHSLWLDALAGRDPDTRENRSLWNSALKKAKDSEVVRAYARELRDTFNNVVPFVSKSALESVLSADDESSTSDDETPLKGLVTLSSATYEAFEGEAILLKSWKDLGKYNLNPATIEKLKACKIVLVDVGTSRDFNKVKWTIHNLNKALPNSKIKVLQNGREITPNVYEGLCLNSFLTPAISFTLTEDNPYIPKDEVLAELTTQHKVIGFKFPQGAGKTEVMGAVIKHYQSECPIHLPVINITHRDSLANSLSERFEIPYIDSVVKAQSNPFTSGVSMCIDSLYDSGHAGSKACADVNKTDGNLILVWDELVQGLEHLIFSSTLKQNRTAIMANLALLLKKVQDSEYGRVLCADADLTDFAVNALINLMGMKPQDESSQCLFFKGKRKLSKARRTMVLAESKADLLAKVFKVIETGEKLWIHTGSQKADSTWSGQNIETHIKMMFPDVSMVLVDSATVKDKNHPGYCGVTNIDALLQTHQIVITTPVISTGVSINEQGLSEVQKVKHVFKFGSVAEDAKSARQALERLRSTCNVYACIPEFSDFGKILNGALTPYWITKQLINQSKSIEDAGNYEAALKADLEHKVFGQGSPYTLLYASLAAALNTSKNQFSNEFIRRAIEDGYEILNLEGINDAESSQAKDNQKLIKSGAAGTYYHGVEAAENLTNDEFERLNKKEKMTQAEDLALEKYYTAKAYELEPSEVTASLVAEHRKYGVAALRRDFWLKVWQIEGARDTAVLIEKMGREKAVHFQGALWLPDSNKSSFVASTDVLHKIDLIGFLQRTEGEMIHKYHPELLDLIDRVKAHRNELNTVLNLTLSEKALCEPVIVLRRLLALIHYGLGKSERVTLETGERVHQYPVVTLGTIDRQELSDRMKLRLSQELGEHQEFKAVPDAVTPEYVCSIA